MKFAMIIDGCVQRSYFIKDGKSYKLKANNLEPYRHHHSIGNECHLGLWNYPFLFEGGHFINLTEWDELPKLDLDLILIALERYHGQYDVNMIRKAYPNAIIVSFCKESYWVRYTPEQRIKFFSECDRVTFPWLVENDPYGGIMGLNQLTQLTGKKAHHLSYPFNIDYLYNKYYQEDRLKQILSYKSPEAGHNGKRSEGTATFADRMGQKYNIEVVQKIIKNPSLDPEHKTWELFLDAIKDSTFCFNLDTTPYGGTMGVQCAALGLLNIGGIQDSHRLLWTETATNNETILDQVFSEILQDTNKHHKMLQNAYNKANELYSLNAIKDKLLKIAE